MITKLARVLAGFQAPDKCRRCNEPLHPRDAVGASEALCVPCRLDPGRATPAAY
jgi:hypothetical protein